jgi:type I restriction enzyme R subunit
MVKVFNERHGTTFTEGDMIRLEQVNREIIDDDMAEVLRNNPPEVVYKAFAAAFFRTPSACSSAITRCGICAD